MANKKKLILSLVLGISSFFLPLAGPLLLDEKIRQT
jgi:hypothetical protein